MDVEIRITQEAVVVECESAKSGFTLAQETSLIGASSGEGLFSLVDNGDSKWTSWTWTLPIAENRPSVRIRLLSSTIERLRGYGLQAVLR